MSGAIPGQFCDHISSAIVHSQGVVLAVGIKALTSFKLFTKNTKKAIHWFFFCGLHAQEVFPVLSLDPSIVDDAVEGSEGIPSLMLAVTRLVFKNLSRISRRSTTIFPRTCSCTYLCTTVH
jgi:fatty acid synthase subunit beta